MITVRHGNERGHTQIGWLDSYHTFSFDQYFDPRFMGFRHLRVLNEDRVEPRRGFPTHPHRDMEIITYVLEGALEHKDSMGNGSVIRPGEVQRMSAGTGITHSEFNASDSEPVHFLQVWVLPEEKRLQPSYEQRAFPCEDGGGGFRLVASRNPHDGAVKIHQNAELFVARLKRGEEAAHRLAPTRHAWLQVARGAVSLNGNALKAGDGAAVSGEERVEVRADEPSELLLFDLA